jgi:transcriptional regulator with XRE-family HTH domain
MRQTGTPQRPSSVDITVGRNVHIWRMARGLSQAELGDQIGITLQQVQKYEVGANRISTGRLVKIAKVLRIPLEELSAGVGNGRDAPLLVLKRGIDPSSLRTISLCPEHRRCHPEPPRP